MRAVVISIVIPVFESAAIIGTTIDRVMATCEREGWDYEVVAVDDASRDDTLRHLQVLSRRYPRLRVLTTPLNGGQHRALLRGLKASTGAIAVCMDDDLQHRPESIPALVRAVQTGHDAVFARFDHPQHAPWRRVGSAVVRAIDRVVFGAPRWLHVTSFRAIHRTVVDRVCAYGGSAPYVRGQILLASRSPTNVDVEHLPRGAASSYSPVMLVGVVVRVLLEWSVIPAVTAVCAGALVLSVSAALLLAGNPNARVLAPLGLAYGVALTGLGLFALRRTQERRVAQSETCGERADAVRRGV